MDQLEDVEMRSSSNGSTDSFNLASILFGNVDEKGNLVDDNVLDAESKKYLPALSEMCLKPLLSEMIEGAAIKEEELFSQENSEESVTPVDYYDISEDFCENQSPVEKFDVSRIELGTSNQQAIKIETDVSSHTVKNDNAQEQLSTVNSTSVMQPLKKTPLANVLPEKYANVDVTELFPDFRHNKVVRFSRIFRHGKRDQQPNPYKPLKRIRKESQLLESEKTEKKEESKLEIEPCQSEEFLKPLELKRSDLIALSASVRRYALNSSIESDESRKKSSESSDPSVSNNVALYRYGPAQYWYDKLNVPPSGEGFDYGFKLKKESIQKKRKTVDIPDEAFLMVAQTDWETKIIYDGDECKEEVIKMASAKAAFAGWLPTTSLRTAQTFSKLGKGISPSAVISQMTQGTNIANVCGTGNGGTGGEEAADDTWYSIFPVENQELIWGDWEKDIIYDPDNMDLIPKPKVLTLDPNDESIVLGIPEDVDPSKKKVDNAAPVKVKIPHPHVKKSKLLLGKAGVINVLEDESTLPPAKSENRDFFNISNDDYYTPKFSETLRLRGTDVIQHSTPVVELRAPFVQTQMGQVRLRHFHRPPLKRYSHGALAFPGPHSVAPLLKTIRKRAKQREHERIASGGGDMFFMRTPEDLTGKDGELILVEFSEEHPPLINQVGMCSKIKTYYKRTAGKDSGPCDFRYGEVAYAHTSPFLGTLAPGKSIQVVENIMYRTPIYEHNKLCTDFLVIRTRNQYYIREFDTLFTAGQLCPLYEVPGPNSKRANNFVRDFLQVFIYRLFWKSRDNPKRIRMDDIRKAFPSHSESSIRKRLKLCADFKRTGTDSNWWVIKSDFRLPPEDEIRDMVSPEQVCAYFSMIAAEQRLKDAGYGEKSLFTSYADDDEDLQLKMEDEIKVAPWHTTRAYIQAMKGKCLLQLTGPADPTGCGEGFSYIRVPNKPVTKMKEEEPQPKRMVTGTDADLRRLSLNNAKALLRKSGVPEEEIKKLSRWEVIDVVRTLSTAKSKAGEQGMNKFSRGNRFSIAEHQERYKEECQRIFDLQNKVLSSAEVLSTDEGESSDEEDASDIEEMGKNIENMLVNKKSTDEMSFEREQKEKQELLRKMLAPNGEGASSEDSRKIGDAKNRKGRGRTLKIYRTFRDLNGREYTRMEIVRRSTIIDAYAKIRTTKDGETFLKQFSASDEAQREEMKREKRRIQEQLRRIKRNQRKELGSGGNLSLGSPSTDFPVTKTQGFHVPMQKPSKSVGKESVMKLSKPMKMKPDLKVKCGACGNTGHMRTNRACPQYHGPVPSVNVALTQEQEAEMAREINEIEVENLVNVEGTKLKLSTKLLKHAEDVKRRSLLLKVPKDALRRHKKKHQSGDAERDDYLKKHKKPVMRKRTDPLVVLSTLMESILNEMRDLPGSQPFCYPVNAKSVPDYYNIVSHPMDLQTMREKLRQKKYHTREDFLQDVDQIVKNSTLYNGAGSSLTAAASNLLVTCVKRLSEKEDKIMRLEKTINPLLDDDVVGLSYILESALNKLKVAPEAWPFVKPVNKKAVKDYYDIVKNPMDLETIGKNISKRKYRSRKDFLADLELIVENCKLYNGHNNEFTQKAETLYNTAKSLLDDYDQHLQMIETKIKVEQDSDDERESVHYAQDQQDSKIELDDTDHIKVERDSDEERIVEESLYMDDGEDDISFDQL